MIIKSTFISTFILLCVLVIESSILSNFSFLIVVPDLILICSIYFSLLNGRFFGETTGFISGLLLDFSTGIPFGFNCLIRTIIGYIFGFFSESVILKGTIIPMISVAIGTFLKILLMYLARFFFPNVNIYLPSIFSYDFLFELVFNVILSPFIFKFLNLFVKNISITSIKEKIDGIQ